VQSVKAHSRAEEKTETRGETGRGWQSFDRGGRKGREQAKERFFSPQRREKKVRIEAHRRGRGYAIPKKWAR